MNSLVADIQVALRQLRKSPGFAATAILTLALGIGAATAIFTLIYQVMLRPLPVPHPEQLYKIGKEIECCNDGGLLNDWPIFSYSLYQYFRDQTPGTAGIAAVEAGGATVSIRRAGDAAPAQSLDTRFVSGNYFSLLGVAPYAGRLLSAEDGREGAPPVAVLSYRVWRAKFHADPGMIGSALLLSGHPFTVIGVAAPAFLGERNDTDPVGIWLPLALEPVLEPEYPFIRLPGAHSLDLLTRVEDHRGVPAVQQAIIAELHQWLNAHRDTIPGGVSERDIARQTTELAPARTGINDLNEGYGKSLQLLQLVASFVLLIACANLANLLLVRGMTRRQELAVRTALGAPRMRLVRTMLMEAALLSLAGGAVALGVAYAGSRAILAMVFRTSQYIPIDPAPSVPIIAFAFATAFCTAILFGTAPAWLSSRSNPVEALRGAKRGSDSRGSVRPQEALVIVQAALSLTILSTAGLLVQSLRHLEHQDFRFAAKGRILANLDFRNVGYRYDQLAGLYNRFDDALGRLPGVQNFAYATYSPMAGNNWSGDVVLPGLGQQPGTVSYAAVSANYFRTVGTHILTGRAVNAQDTAASAHVAVVNRAFTDRFLKGRQPIGEHFGPDPQHGAEFTIVGVAEDTKYRHPKQPVPPMYFTPITQTTAYTDRDSMTAEHMKHYATNLIVQYRGESAAASAQLRHALAQIDPNIPILSLTTYEDELGDAFTTERLVMRLTSVFGLLALLLASIGLYGVTAYAVARRTSEIGLRMALGASRKRVLCMVVRRALLQALLGLALGLPLCFAAARLLQHTLYQTSSFQPFVLLAVAALLLASALAAALIPARRAALIDPMHALRIE